MNRRTMARHALIFSIALFMCSSVTLPVAGEEVIFLEEGSEWKYFRGLTEASSPDHEEWRRPDFDDAAWETGAAPFGFGNSPPYGTDLSALEPPMRRNYSTVYLRRQFEIPSVADVTELHAMVDFDDGFILFINGKEVAAFNAPGADGEFIPFDQTATRSHSPGDFEDFLLDVENVIVDGTNTVAVQFFNVSASSNDAKFETFLVDPFGPDLTTPKVRQLFPIPNTTVRKLAQIEVLFDEVVSGVDASDLLVNGQPATQLDGQGAGPYFFSFDEPPTGEVSFAWADGHGIADTAPALNRFEGGSWVYNLDPNAATPSLVINEILAANGSGLADEDDDVEDWIEIFNAGDEAVNIGGWSLTDDPQEPGKWVFPPVVIEPRGYLVVFASAKDRADPESKLHTNFKLRDPGEYLGLFSSELPREPVSEFEPEFPPQRFDRSYGVSQTGELAYFEVPTPGAANEGNTISAGFTGDPEFSVERGFHDEPFELTITAENGATILYTLDGSVPGPGTATEYTGPLTISGGDERGLMPVRAIAVREDRLPSEVVTHSYVFPEQVLGQTQEQTGFPPRWGTQPADYEMDPQLIDSDPDMARDGMVSLPTVSIVTEPEHLFDARTGIYANAGRSGILWERPTSAELIFPDGKKGFQIPCGIRVQGGSSTGGWKARKVSLRLLFKGDYGAPKLRYRLFPESPVSRFDSINLDAFMNLTLNHPDHGQRIQSQYVRDQFVADLQNEGGGTGPHGFFANLFLNGVYWGLYAVHERPDASFAAEHFGGEKEEYDALRHDGTNAIDGGREAYAAMNALSRASLVDQAAYEALGAMLDYENFANYMMVNFWCGNTDWAHHNWWATRRRVDGAKFRYHSWDPEHVLKSVSQNSTGRTDNGDDPTDIFQRARRNREFQVLFGDMVHKHFFNGGMFYTDAENPEWDPEHPERNRPEELYMRRIEEVRSAILLEYARWGDNYRARTYVYNDWLNELGRLQTTYFTRRSEIVLNQFKGIGVYPRLEAPVYDQHGGEIDAGFTLSMSLPEGTEGTIHYTLDGSDPRVAHTEEVSPTAIAYNGPVALGGFTVVKSRNLSEETWSALNEAMFTVPVVSADSLVISEIMYNPAEGGSSGEFIELFNPTDTAIDLEGMEFSDGIEYMFSAGDTIAAGEYLVLASDGETFSRSFPDVPLAGEFNANLAGAGERVTLSDRAGDIVFSVAYDDEGFWPIAPDGFGYSLVLEDALLDPDDPRAWRASAEIGGSPGEADPEPRHGGVVINEVLTSGAVGAGSIELHNLTGSLARVGNWVIGNSRADDSLPGAYTLADGTEIPARGYIVIEESELPFTLDERGGELYLGATDGAGFLSGYITSVQFGAADPGVAFGRHETSTSLEFTAMSAPTFGGENSEPRAPELAINEVHYHPIVGGEEFVELFNPGSRPVSLDGWTLSGIADRAGDGDYAFPAGTTVPAGGYLVIASIAPDVFRGIHSVPEAAVVVGPFGGGLDNNGERLRLLKPLAADAGALVLVDMVRFNDADPWPADTDGEGKTLERVRATDFGNEVTNWAASETIDGTPGRQNSVSEPAEPPEGGNQLPGDLNQDSRLNITDAVGILGSLFGGAAGSLPCGATMAEPGNTTLLDASGDGSVNLTDAVQLLTHLFQSGPAHILGRDCVVIVGCPDACE